MECYYHPEREGTDTCAICGKSVCKECGLEIAGKIYCKDCLEKIVGLGLSNAAAEPASEPVESEPIRSEPARLNKQTSDESIYAPQDVEPITPQHNIDAPEPVVDESRSISNDSPYNIKDNIEYTGGLESSYMDEPAPQVVQKEIPQQETPSDDFIYPDHSYEPEPRAGENLEDKYERYLDDLYFDENEVPLTEQLAKDEEQYGSLTKKPHKAQKPAEERQSVREPGKKITADEELEAKIRDEIEKEMKAKENGDGKTIHNLNYQQEKEPLGAVDILLIIILVIVILIVIYYLVYLFVLNASYPTFMDAVRALSNPQNVINNVLK